MDEAQTIRESYGDVLSRLGSGATLPPEEAIDAEIERVARSLQDYLDVYRERMHAASFWNALNPMDVKDHRRLTDAMLDAQAREDDARVQCAAIEAERGEGIKYLTWLLELRREDMGGATPAPLL